MASGLQTHADGTVALGQHLVELVEAGPSIAHGEGGTGHLAVGRDHSGHMVAFGDINATEVHRGLLENVGRSQTTSGLYETLSLVGDARPGRNLLFETACRTEATVFLTRQHLKDRNVGLGFYGALSANSLLADKSICTRRV